MQTDIQLIVNAVLWLDGRCIKVTGQRSHNILCCLVPPLIHPEFKNSYVIMHPQQEDCKNCENYNKASNSSNNRLLYLSIYVSNVRASPVFLLELVLCVILY